VIGRPPGRPAAPVRLAVVCAAGALLMVACSGSSGSTTAPPPSVPCGVSPIGGGSVRHFCGTGTVSVHAGAQAATLAGAECVFGQNGVTVNAGDLVLGRASGAGAFSYVGLDVKGVPAAPGGTDPSYRGLVSADVRGHVFSVTDATVTLAPGGRTGSAQGTGRDGSSVVVTFAC